MKRLISLLLTAAVLFTLASCGTGDGGKTQKDGEYEYTSGYDETMYNEPGTLPIFKDKQTITLTVRDSQYVEDWDTNYQTNMLEEDLNAELVFTVMPNKEYATKLNLMVAAGGQDLTEAVLGSFDDQTVLTFADSGCVLPLTEYYYNTDIAYYIHESMERLGWNYLNQITMADGEIYGIPKVNDTKSLETPVRQWLYEPWCEQLGIDIDSIHTRDEFKDALTKIVSEDPNNNGKKDELGIVGTTGNDGWFEYLMNTFVYAGDEQYLLVEDGNLSFAFTREEWKEGLKYMRDMCSEGLISPLSFTQDGSAFKSMLNADTVVVGSFNSTGTGTINSGDKRRVEYKGVAPLNSDYAGGRPLASFTPNTAETAFLVTNRAQNPEVVFRFGDYMCSLKNSITTRFGEEGVDWLRPQEGDTALYAALGYEPYLKPILVWSTKQNKHWYQTGPYVRQDEIVSGQVWSGDPYDHTLVMAEAQVKYRGMGPDEYITKLIYTEEENEIVSQYLPGVINYVDEFSAKAITGAIDIDAQWDAFQKQLVNMNIGEIIENAQSAYDRFVGA